VKTWQTGRSAATACLALALAIAAPTSSRAAEALIAVATNFAATADALAPAFESETGHGVTFATGSTGKLHAQIEQGAPFDALLSADVVTPERLEAGGLAEPGTRFVYAVGQLVVWSADPARVRGDGPAVLRDPSIRHVALANPDLAPYGAAARAALRRLGVWNALEPRIVLGQNVGQALSLVAAGAADVGIVARAQLVGRDPALGGSAWPIPSALHDPIRQGAVLLVHGNANAAARAFLEHLRGPAARDVIRRHGYEVE